MRGRIAAHTVALDGFDGWSHAFAFEPFAVPTDADASVDWTMDVRFVPHIARPEGTAQGRGKHTAWSVDPDGNGFLVHTRGAFLLRFNADFSCCSLALREGLPDGEVLRYVYTAQCFAYYLLGQGGCCIHSAALEKDGRSVLLVGPSGVGKSTMATACQQVDDTVRVLCEDLPAVRFESGRPVVYGTPFCGDDTRVTNVQAPLDAIVLLRQAPHERLVKADVHAAIATLTEAMPYPVFRPQTVDAALARVQTLLEQVPIVLFENRGTPEAGQALLKAWQNGFCSIERGQFREN